MIRCHTEVETSHIGKSTKPVRKSVRFWFATGNGEMRSSGTLDLPPAAWDLLQAELEAGTDYSEEEISPEEESS